MKVFVAYARKDAEQAAALVERMRAADLDVRWDQDLKSGDWAATLRTEIIEADHFVWLMSEHSCASVEVTKEFTVAREAGVPCHVLQLDEVDPERAVADARSLHWLPLERADELIAICQEPGPRRKNGHGMLWLALVLGVLGFGMLYLGSRGEKPARAIAVNRLVYLVVDRSEAMNTKVEAGQSRWDLARKVIADELYLRDDRTERFAVRTFGADCDAEETSKRVLSAREPVPTRGGIKQRIGEVAPAGAVTLLAAMKAAAGDIHGLDTEGLQIGQSVMVVITSGRDACIDDEGLRKDIEAVLSQDDVKIRYHFLSFEESADLRLLAEAVSGTVTPVASEADLRKGLSAQWDESKEIARLPPADDEPTGNGEEDSRAATVATRTAPGSSAAIIKDPPPTPGVLITKLWKPLAFDFPIGVIHDDERTYVLEKRGTIQRIDKVPNGVTATLVLDLRDRVVTTRDTGLLGAAFHPDGKHLAVTYVVKSQAGFELRLSLFDVHETVDAATERVLKRHIFRHPLHLGGAVAYGPDGHLYLGLGDGGSNNPTTQSDALRPASWKGKILRFEGSPEGPLRTPKDNPWANQPGRALKAIFAFGYRNPFRFDWDDRGRLWTVQPGTQGADARESVWHVQRGASALWPAFEGSHKRAIPDIQTLPGSGPPAFEYTHEHGAAAIVGGAFYRGTSRGPLTGRFLFGDYVRGRVYSLRIEKGTARDWRRVGLVDRPTSLGRLPNGEVVVCSQDGHIYGFTGR